MGVCALTASGILNLCPDAIFKCTHKLPTLCSFYRRLQSTVARRVWAERAAFPVCSRYVQALIELLSAVKRTGWLTPYKSIPSVDAATPFPLLTLADLNKIDSDLKDDLSVDEYPFWEWDEGWACSDRGWEVWTGTIECMAVEWKTPSRSAVRSLMDGGEGPPMLREGCKVIRGLDWDESGSGSINRQEDGKEIYEKEKAVREKEKALLETNKEKTTCISPEEPVCADDVGEEEQTSELDPPDEECVETNISSTSEQPPH